jgi:hypothetical protein
MKKLLKLGCLTFIVAALVIGGPGQALAKRKGQGELPPGFKKGEKKGWKGGGDTSRMDQG